MFPETHNLNPRLNSIELARMVQTMRRIKKCGKCGEPIKEGTKVCPKCGEINFSRQGGFVR